MVPRLRVQGSLLFATPGSELVHGTVAGQEIRREKNIPSCDVSVLALEKSGSPGSDTGHSRRPRVQAHCGHWPLPSLQ